MAILFQGKLLNYNEATAKILELAQELNEVSAERRDAEDKLIELESEEAALKKKLAGLREVSQACNLNNMVPTELWYHGYRLTGCMQALPQGGGRDFWGEEGSKHTSGFTTIMERDGEVVREWRGCPSLTELFELCS